MKSLRNLFKYIIAGIIALFFVFSGPLSVRADDSKTIVENAQDTNSLSTLVTAVTKAELVDTLNGDGPFTVFAPTNDAFAKLGTTLDTLLKDENKQLLTDILTYHVLPQKVDAEVALTLSEATTVQGDTIALKNNNGSLVLNDSSTVIQTDIEASNGIIHVIDTVILSDGLSSRVSQLSNGSMGVTPRTGGLTAIYITLSAVMILISVGVLALNQKKLSI